MGTPRGLALTGLKVVDFSRLLPGPFASLVLADLGAEVIKVESPRGGDYLRFMPPLTGKLSYGFAALNSGKKSLAVDLKRPEGVEVVRRLLADADVLLESFRPGVMERLGLGYDAVARENPRLIYCAITGYGQDGPLTERAGHDVNYLGLAGVTGLGGPPDGPPTLMPVQVADLGGGSLWALVGILAALFERQRTGRGSLVDTSMTDGSLSLLQLGLSAMLGGGADPPPRGADTLTGGVPCYGIYETRDGGFMTLGALEPKFWQSFCETIGRPDLLPRQFGPPDKAAQTRAEIAAVFATKTRDEWADVFADADACCEPVLRAEEIAGHPLHVARKNVIEDASGLARLRTPVRPPDAPAPAAAPELGEHTRPLLEALGYAPDAIDALASARVVLAPAS